MTQLDLVVLGLYFAVIAGVGVWASKRQATNLASFFVADRNLPWWVCGTSMVAATFSADTPLAVTRFIATGGLAGNWLWWNMAFCHLLATVFFSRMWRRVGVTTDAGLIELRYSGRPAQALRGIKAFYFAVPINALVIGWSILALSKILRGLIDPARNLPPGLLHALEAAWPFGGDAVTGALVVACTLLVLVYASLGGMSAMAVTGFFQFGLAIVGAFMLAGFAVAHVGGLDALTAKIAQTYPGEDYTALVPAADSSVLPLPSFLTYVLVLWWAQKYADGGGLIIQRQASAKDERHAFLGSLWFVVAHYVVRTWPWVLTGLAALVLYPKASDPALDREMTYVLLMRDVLPSGLLGLMVASLVAAFMSTIDAQLNWGASYLVGDIYKRFIKRQASDRHYILASRVAMLLLLVLSTLTAAQMETVGEAWKFLIALGGGVGLVTLARWFWWRVNAWSELAALLASSVIALTLSLISEKTVLGFDNPLYAGPGTAFSFEAKVLWTLVASTVIWVAATYATKPEPWSKLESFYRLARPGGPGWKAVADRVGVVNADAAPAVILRDMALGCGLVFGALAGIRELLFGSTLLGVALCVVAAVSGVTLVRLGQPRAP